MHEPVWRRGVSLPAFPSIKDSVKTDVLIIGGGLCGLLCAHYLKQAGVDCVLLEGAAIASGISGHTTAKITSQHGLIYKKITETYGREKALLYLTANQQALAAYETLCRGIDCDFKKQNAYTYSLRDRRKVEDEVQAVNALGFDAEFVQHVPLPFETKGAICFENQAQFHPLKFIAEIAKDLCIYENTFMQEITPRGAQVNGHSVEAKSIIVATHFPFINKHGGYFLKLYQERSYVSAFSGCPPLDGMYVDEDEKGMSFRQSGAYWLIGGGGHRTGKKGGTWQPIHAFKEQYFPAAECRYNWAAQDAMSLDGIPYIGQYGKNTPNLYVATGFNKWGMTSSMVAAMLLCDLVTGKQNDFVEVFSPQRSMIKPQLLVNGLESAMNLLTPTRRRCPHLGCALKWNKQEHSWDCPCHGSRFNEQGRLLDNPATGDAKIKKD